MVLAECGCTEPVLPKYLSHRSNALRSYPIVTRKTGRCFHNGAGIIAMVIISGKDCHAGRRAQCCGVKAIVAQSVFTKLVQNGHVNWPTEMTGGAKSHIVNQNNYYVRRTLRCFYVKTLWCLRIPCIKFLVRLTNGFLEW